MRAAGTYLMRTGRGGQGKVLSPGVRISKRYPGEHTVLEVATTLGADHSRVT